MNKNEENFKLQISKSQWVIFAKSATAPRQFLSMVYESIMIPREGRGRKSVLHPTLSGGEHGGRK